MRESELRLSLNQIDHEFGKWIFTLGDFLVLFPNESRRNVLQSLSRYTKNGLLVRVCRGVYANHNARSRRRDAYTIARFLRPSEIVYLSKEVRLQQMGLITQVYVDYLSLMTSGRDQTFNTPYGIFSYTHTDRPWCYLKEHLSYNPSTGLMEADEGLAISDLRRSRNTSHLGMYLEECERRTGRHAF